MAEVEEEAEAEYRPSVWLANKLMCFVAKDSQRGRNDGLGYVASLLYSSVLGSSD